VAIGRRRPDGNATPPPATIRRLPFLV